MLLFIFTWNSLCVWTTHSQELFQNCLHFIKFPFLSSFFLISRRPNIIFSPFYKGSLKSCWSCLILHNQNIMCFSLQCSCFSAIPTSNLSVPGIPVPQKGPYELLRSWFGKRLGHPSQMQLWHRDVCWPTSVPALSFMTPTPRTAGRETHISITTHSSVILRKGGLSVPWEKPETIARKLYQEHRAPAHQRKPLPFLFILETSKQPPQLLLSL